MDINEFDRLIELIKFKEGLTEEDIALSVRVNSNYISQMRSKGKVTESFMRKLRLKYGDLIDSVEKAEVSMESRDAIILTMAARQQVQSRYIAEIYAKTAGMSVTKVLTEMEQLEREGAEHLIKGLK